VVRHYTIAKNYKSKYYTYKDTLGGVGGDGGDDILFVVNNGNLWFATTPLQKTTNQNITHIKTWR
jgi:hypothetical protein